MSEDFVNSGWKEKKLWAPSEVEEKKGRIDPGAGGGPRSRLRGETAATGQVVSGTVESSKGSAAQAAKGRPAGKSGTSEAPPQQQTQAAALPESVEPLPKPPKPPKPPTGPLEALDPDSSSSDDSDSPALPPEYAVLDMNVPRTALVINVSHVLKRLNGCCSLNQLTKSIKSFKENTGFTLEAFLRANPMTFKLEGRIVHLLGRDGEKWRPPEEAQQGETWKGKGKGKGEAPKGASKGSGAGGRGGAAEEPPPRKQRGAGGEARKQRGGGAGAAASTANSSWSNSGWEYDWQADTWHSDDRGWSRSPW